MSNTLGTPPVDERYAKALAGQHKAVANRYVFRAERADGIQTIFHIQAPDALYAIEAANAFCDSRAWKLLGRVVSKRSAYDRAAAEHAL